MRALCGARLRLPMKNSEVCPKCASREILHVAGQRDETSIVTGVGGFLTSVPVARYVCGNCGYLELWIDSLDDLARVKQKFGQHAAR